MLRYFSKLGKSSPAPPESVNIAEEQANVQEERIENDEHRAPFAKYKKIDMNELPTDPGERPSMEFYNPSQRDDIRKAYLLKGPCQPENHSFQQREIGGISRKFNPGWFDDYKYWMEYSIKKEAVFCLCCYLFKSEIKNQRGADNYVVSGFQACNKKKRLDVHNDGDAHKMAIQKCQSLMNHKQSITAAFYKQGYWQKKSYHIRLSASVECVRFLLRQGLPFRGHDEHSDSVSKGNFLELLHWLAGQCEKIASVVLKKAPKNSQWKCSSIQKEIARAAAKEVESAIIKEIGDDFFSILVDESRDVSCKEQMALVLRFVNVEGVVVERFIGIKQVNDTSALSLKTTIYSMLLGYGLSPSSIRGQGYDGASNMSGAFNGLKTLIMKESKSAHFIHCFAHQLQLALVFVAKNHYSINDFFEQVSGLLNMICSSYKRRDLLGEKQATHIVAALASGDIESGTGQNQEVGMKRPCDTRWGSHYGSLLNIMSIYPSICEVLEDISETGNCQDQRAESRRLLRSLLKFEFVFCLHLMVHILEITNDLNKTLQRKDQDIVNAMQQVRSSKTRLQDMRDRGWEPLLEKVTSFCGKNNAQILNMDDPYYDGISRRRGSQVSSLHHYKVDLFYSVIDMQLRELNNRFNEVNTTLLISMASLNPSKSFKSFQVEELMKMAEFYPFEFPKHELEVLRGQLNNYIVDVRGDTRFSNLKGIGDLSKMMVETNKSIIYPKVYLLLKLALILPVATSTVERAFSAMKIIKSDLRNKLGDQFMNDCLLTYIEKNVLDGISNDAIMDEFYRMGPRRKTQD